MKACALYRCETRTLICELIFATAQVGLGFETLRISCAIPTSWPYGGFGILICYDGGGGERGQPHKETSSIIHRRDSLEDLRAPVRQILGNIVWIQEISERALPFEITHILDQVWQ